jgi:hypothetical protein
MKNRPNIAVEIEGGDAIRQTLDTLNKEASADNKSKTETDGDRKALHQWARRFVHIWGPVFDELANR